MQIIYNFDFAQSQANMFRLHRMVDGRGETEIRGMYQLDEHTLPQWALRHIEPIEADLLDMAMALHIADRLALRKPTGVRDVFGLWWARRIKVRIAVREIERWEDSQVHKYLSAYLPFNSGDDWQLEFVPRVAPRTASESQRCLCMDVRETWKRRYPDLRIALFSGGVDSLAGLAHELCKHQEARFSLISVNSNRTLLRRQDHLLAAVPNLLRERIQHIPINLRLGNVQTDEYPSWRLEKSLRTRGLLFLTAGAIAAAMAGREEFFVYENGIGALNLPFDRSQVTGHNTRAVHPRSLALFSRFLTALLRRPMRAVNPFQFTTKGELCQVLESSPWHDLIARTFTCGHPQRIKDVGIRQCGVCTSCVGRRQALRVAGLSQEDTQGYVYDLSTPAKVPFGKRGEWNAMHAQRGRIERVLHKASGAGEAWMQLVREFPDLLETVEDMMVVQKLSEAEIQRGILSLLRTYVAEGLDLVTAPLQILSTPEESYTSNVAVG